ncbi:hypothetical protein COBT_004098, partial [Conglomerata obtusa]
MENGNKQTIWEFLEFERSGNDLSYEKFISQIKSEIIDKNNRLCEFEKIKKEIEKEKIMKDEINYLKNIVYKMKNNVEHKRKRGFGERKAKTSVCWICGDSGHISLFCKQKINKRDDNYIEGFNKRYHINYNFKIHDIKKEFPFLVDDGLSKIKFYKKEKCKITTQAGKIIRKNGGKIPQAMEMDAIKYIENLKKRGIIRNSMSGWRNPVRF